MLVVITPGLDGGSVTTAGALTRLAGQSGVLIYTIGLTQYLACETPEARHVLKALAEATGGEAFFPANPAAMETVCRRIARDIREQYVIAYTPTDEQLNNAFRRISVRVTGPGHRSRVSVASTARLAQSSRGRGLARRSTATTCRSTKISASLDADGTAEQDQPAADLDEDEI